MLEILETSQESNGYELLGKMIVYILKNRDLYNIDKIVVCTEDSTVYKNIRYTEVLNCKNENHNRSISTTETG